MAILKDDTKRLFGEQVNDHIAKLNDLMSLSSGAPFDEQAVRRACLATRLLEGSTRMLDFSAWSRTLKSLRELMERSTASGRRWDEQLSQVVSEVLETEEQITAEILSGELEEAGRPERFAGLEREMECLVSEPAEGSVEEPFSLPRAESVEQSKPTDTGVIAERVSTFTRLIESLGRVRDLYQEMIDKPGSDRLVREIETAYGESEYFMRIATENLRRLSKSQRPFQAKIGSAVVLDGLKDFFTNQARLRRWNARLATRSGDFTLDGEMAATFASVLMCCILDICRRYEMREEIALSIGVDVRCEGSYFIARIQDNGPDFLSDSEIDRDDAGAFYQCLREIRPRLESTGSILWLEPRGSNECRFMFTLPRSRGKTDYLIVSTSGKRLAVPRHAVDTVIGMDSVELMQGEVGRAIMLGGMRVPVHAIEELVTEEFEARSAPDRILVLGLAERRIGLLVEGAGRTVEAILEQVTEGSWGALTNGILNIGEDEFPIIDAGCIMHTANSLLGMEGDPEEAGSYVEAGSQCEKEVTVPRA